MPELSPTDARIVYLVKIRLEPSKPFREIDTRSRLYTLKEAEARVDEWYKFVAPLKKAKPEATIEALSQEHLADCFVCKAPQYKGDVVFATLDKTYCHKCAYEVDTGIGFFDLLGELL